MVLAIYLTLGLAGRLAETLSATGLSVAGFVLGLLLAITAVVTMGLKLRVGGIEVGIALGVGTVYFMVPQRLTVAERTHLFEYGILALLVYQALHERAANGRHVPVPELLAVVAAALVGAIDEGIQALLPNRTFDPRDTGFNALGAAMAVLAVAALTRIRNWLDRRTVDR